MSRQLPHLTTTDVEDLMMSPYFLLDRIEERSGQLLDDGFSFVIIRPAPLYSRSQSEASVVTYDPHAYYNSSWLVEPTTAQELSRMTQNLQPISILFYGGWLFPGNRSQEYIIYVLENMITTIQNNPRNNMRQNNPDQRTVDLRAKYRAVHGDDWWKDDEIKAEYRVERQRDLSFWTSI